MKKDIFEKLYVEIFEIKNKIDKDKDYVFRKMNKNDGIEYLIILNNNTTFYISIGTNILPNFDKEDVLYIRKKITDCEFIDTEIGYFETNDQLSHGYEMEHKFNAIYDFDTHCYDLNEGDANYDTT